MATRETELPGVGTKHTLELGTGAELVVVEHRAGRWELARVDAEGSTTPVLQLQPKEASEPVVPRNRPGALAVNGRHVDEGQEQRHADHWEQELLVVELKVENLAVEIQ